MGGGVDVVNGMEAALERAGLVARGERGLEANLGGQVGAEYLAQCTVGYWMHTCAGYRCRAQLPRHLVRCGRCSRATPGTRP